MHGLDDLLIPCAPADIAVNRFADLLISRVRIFLKERYKGHQEPRCAETTLQGVFFVERLLQRMQILWCTEGFHGANFMTIRLHGEHQAGADGFAIKKHSARAADAVFAANMSAQ